MGVWVGYGGVKTLENRSRKFNLLIFLRLPRYVYMDDILSRFKRKERGSSRSFHTVGALFAYATSGTKSHRLRVR